MRWYFAIDQQGAEGEAGDLAKLAVTSSRLCPGLEPRLLYHGSQNTFTSWMEQAGVTIITTAPPCLDAIEAATSRGTFRGHTIGHWLRLAIPLVDHDADFALYTDCDVAFLRPIDFSTIRPTIFAAAPEFAPDRWDYFNSGVMVLNLAAMRAAQPAFETVIRTRLDEDNPNHFDDQVALNQAFAGHWSRLDPQLNTKPYWPHNPNAGILHLHGPKLGGISAIATNTWNWNDPTSIQIGSLCDAHPHHYIAWLTDLAERLQLIDLPTTIRLHRLATSLANHTQSHPQRTHDLSFMHPQHPGQHSP